MKCKKATPVGCAIGLTEQKSCGGAETARLGPAMLASVARGTGRVDAKNVGAERLGKNGFLYRLE